METNKSPRAGRILGRGVVISALALAFATSAEAQPGDGWYRLKTELQGPDKCLESNQLTEPADSLVATTMQGVVFQGASFMDGCQDVSGQMWQFLREGSTDVYRLKSMFQGEDKCLQVNAPDPSGSGAVLGGAAFMGDCQVGDSRQLWQLTPVGGSYNLTNQAQGGSRCLTAQPFDWEDENNQGPAFMKECGAFDQKWMLVEIDAGSTTTVPTDRQPTNLADISCDNPSLAPTPSAISAADQALILSMHNAARQAVGNAPLVWDDGLAQHAQGWANVLAEVNRLRAAGQTDARVPGAMGAHSDNSCYSRQYTFRPENISSGSATVTEAIQMWIDEGPYWQEPQRRCAAGQVCGHYLQVVAQFVTKVGCGHNASSSWICSYDRFGDQRMADGTSREPYARNN